MARRGSTAWVEELNTRAREVLLNRRELLLGLGAAGAALTLGGCGSETDSTPSPATPTPTPGMLDGYASLRALVRSSPDHLSARAAEIVASKDPARAVRFVRDQIAVLPPARDIDVATDAVRWGPDGTLRAGAGTQRERAELLKAMLAAMGATVAIKQADRPAGIDAAALYKTRPPASSVDTSMLASSLGSDAASQLSQINAPFPDASPDAVLSKLHAILPSGQAQVKTPFDGLDPHVPVVEYTLGGVTKWAFALGTVAEVSAAPSGLGSGELPSPDYPNVSVRLLAAFGDMPGVPTPTGLVELASGSWKADQLAGGRLLISTGSSNPTVDVGAPSEQVLLRSAVMHVSRPTAQLGTDAALWSPTMGGKAPAAAVGAPFTLGGARFAAGTQPGDPPVGPYGSVVQLDSAAHAAALASVKSLNVTANGGAFPDVQLTVSAFDGGGAPVYGLTRADFVITDEGAAETPVLLSNAGAPQVKVMLAYDCSGSVTWPTPADKTAFDNQIEQALVNAASPNPYLLGVATLGSDPGSYAAPDATAIETLVSSCVSFSDIWTTLGQVAPNDGASAVVIVSDFLASDDPAAIPALQQRLSTSGLKVALVPVGTVDQATVGAIVAACGATVLDYTATDFQQKLGAFVAQVAADAKEAGYRFTYRLPADQQKNQSTRTVKVSLMAAPKASTSATYTVPAKDARGALGIYGLYLELGIGWSQTVRHRLSGSMLDHFGNARAPAASDYDETRALLSGLIAVAFEPGSPTSAQNVDDLLSGVLSFKPLLDNPQMTLAESLPVGAKVEIYSGPLCMLVDPIAPAANDPAVAPEFMRVAVARELVGPKGFEYRTDVVPELNLTVAGSTDAAAAFRATMRQGIVLSQRESYVQSGGAAKALASASLQYLGPSADPAMLSGFSADDRTRWASVFDEYGSWHRFVPTDPSVGAMWVVDPATGTTVAVLLDGTGGGGGSCDKAFINAEIQTICALLQVYIAYIALNCEEGMTGIACEGGLVAGVGLLVVASFAGATLDKLSTADLLLMPIGVAFGALNAPAGLAVSVIAFMVAALESLQSINEHC